MNAIARKTSFIYGAAEEKAKGSRTQYSNKLILIIPIPPPFATAVVATIVSSTIKKGKTAQNTKIILLTDDN
jgi:hypothetical protein